MKGLKRQTMKNICLLFLIAFFYSNLFSMALALDVTPPASPVKLIFIHHSCGENWLAWGEGADRLCRRQR
ncbi:MAG: hypothetical protein DRH24_18390 [Deltaproteobacteria bacterium]|nr:MAG: hypothetical protein DRH24_18390 [Deltaproteobacteria bacterium]